MTIKLNAATGGGSVSLSAPNSTTSNLDVELTLPVDDGAANTFLKSDGAGTLSWASASSDNITEGNTTVECVDTGSDGHITFDTEGSERARFDSSGRLLVGTTSVLVNDTSDARVQILGGTNELPGLRIQGTNSNNAGCLQLGNDPAGSGTTCGIRITGDTGGGTNYNTYRSSGGDPRHSFSTNSTERMRISSNGLTSLTTTAGCIDVGTTQGAGTSYWLYTGRYSATEGSMNTGTVSVIIYSNGNIQNTNGSYTQLSDAKLKENIVDAGSQWDDIKAIRIRNWNFKEETGYETHRQIGPVAQELETVCPGLVFETPDKEQIQVPVLDEDGNTVFDANGEQVFNTETRDLDTTTKGVHQSVLYMKAVKALQEAMERIETLETANASLEARLTALEGGAS